MAEIFNYKSNKLLTGTSGDDFIANGAALNGLIDIVNASGATLVGCGTVIEKGFQPGGKMLRDKGIRVESLAIIESIDEINQKINFSN